MYIHVFIIMYNTYVMYIIYIYIYIYALSFNTLRTYIHMIIMYMYILIISTVCTREREREPGRMAERAPLRLETHKTNQLDRKKKKIKKTKRKETIRKRKYMSREREREPGRMCPRARTRADGRWAGREDKAILTITALLTARTHVAFKLLLLIAIIINSYYYY